MPLDTFLLQDLVVKGPDNFMKVVAPGQPLNGTVTLNAFFEGHGHAICVAQI